MDRRDRLKWIFTSRDNSDLAARDDRWAATCDSDLDEVFGWIGPQRWQLAQVSQPFRPMPDGEPDLIHRVWAYQVC